MAKKRTALSKTKQAQMKRLEELLEKADQVGFEVDLETYTMQAIGMFGIVYVGYVARQFVDDGIGTSGQVMNYACNSFNSGEIL